MLNLMIDDWHNILYDVMKLIPRGVCVRFGLVNHNTRRNAMSEIVLIRRRRSDIVDTAVIHELRISQLYLVDSTKQSAQQ